jgi:4-alpha-glucanotransferase
MQPFHMTQRRAGILLHPTSLPSHTLDDADHWLEFLALSGISVWQMLPLGVPQDGLCPYQCNSAFAVNPALLQEMAPLDESDPGYAEFIEAQSYWLHDYALFVLLKQRFEQRPWHMWPQEYKFRNPEALQQLRNSHHAQLRQTCWEQYQLHTVWQRLRHQAEASNIALFGDIPIFVAHDSADVWVWPELFLLDEEGMPTVVTGVPPDYFSATGQRWGNPHYNWERMRDDGFKWWMMRLQHHFEWFDLVRIDHFRGLVAVWEIDTACATAVDGFWQKTPGEELLSILQKYKEELPLVAEDLGVITADVVALKEKFHLPGMAILQFSFDHFDDNPHKPHNILENTVCYTGTHDNNTTRGWFDSMDAQQQQHVLDVLGIDSEKQVVESMITMALDSRANLAVIPLQDFLSLGSEARMNTPGTTDNNWLWAFTWEQLDIPAVSRSIRTRLEESNRMLT